MKSQNIRTGRTCFNAKWVASFKTEAEFVAAASASHPEIGEDKLKEVYQSVATEAKPSKAAKSGEKAEETGTKS